MAESGRGLVFLDKVWSKKWLLLLIVLLIGFTVRLYPLFTISFRADVPFGNGGLYIQFAKEIREARYHLPSRIPYYTPNGVPYAYPPLAFYILALLFDFTSVGEFAAMNFLPTLISCLTVVAFYAMAWQILREPRAVFTSSLIYALLPAAFIEHTFGDGLVEALGTFSYIAAVMAMARLNRRNDFTSSLLLGVAIGLNVYSSPGSTYATAVSTIVFWAFGSQKRCSIVKLMTAIAIGVLISAPYWSTVIINHSPGIFSHTWFHQHSIKKALAKMWFDKTGEPHLALWGALTLLGLLYRTLSGRYVVPAWFFVTYLIPREHQYLMAIPMAILAAEGLLKVLLPGVRQIPLSGISCRLSTHKAAISAAFALVVFVYGGASAVAVARSLPEQQAYVGQDELAIMEWVHQHTNASSSFLVIGDEIEWFPEITERSTVNVVQGSEWVRSDRIYQFHNAVDSCETVECCLQVAATYEALPNYVYVSKSSDRALMIAMERQDDDLLLEQENDGAVLFAVAP